MKQKKRNPHKRIRNETTRKSWSPSSALGAFALDTLLFLFFFCRCSIRNEASGSVHPVFFFLGFLFLARFFFVGRAVAVSRFAYHVMATGGSTFWCADRSFRFTFFFVILWRGLLRKTTQSFLIFACPFLLFEHTHFFRYFLSLLPFSSIARFCNVAPSFRLLFCRFVVLPPAP